ncbi:LlaJI family restriction endonuclease [Corynebacterium sp. S1S1]|uniref:LlaJI family restriction endonuclease n=1 Tax=Corynebacterium sp. S1S1 TaxID=1881619 RepID=UPI000B158146|nr:LlaJI family restriction endonuclease [Corynebacterium sp. S1S1]
MNLHDIVDVADGDRGESFIGLAICNGAPRVTFPLGYSKAVPEDTLRADIRQLLSLLSIFEHRHSELWYSNAVVDESASVNDMDIPSYSLLIEDYLTYRELLNPKRDSFSNDQQRCIDWNRTIGCTQPVISQSNVVYLDVVARSRTSSENSLIELAHLAALRRSVDVLGWLYPPFALPVRSFIPDVSILIEEVRSVLSETFNDRKIRLLRAILSVLAESSTQYSSELSRYGVNKFDVVWEYMLDQFLGSPTVNKQVFYPRTSWNVNGEPPAYPSPLRPDTIMVHGDIVTILDAKYYRYGVTFDLSHLPGSADIGKQVIYGEFAKLHSPVSQSALFNAFLIPSNLYEQFDNWFSIIGFADASWIVNPQPHQRILCVLVDFRFLLNNYGRYRSECVEELAVAFSDMFERGS